MAKLDDIVLAMSVRDAARVAGLGRSTIYTAIGTGTLRAHRIGNRTQILREDLETWLRSLESWKPMHERPELKLIRASLKPSPAA